MRLNPKDQLSAQLLNSISTKVPPSRRRRANRPPLPSRPMRPASWATGPRRAGWRHDQTGPDRRREVHLGAGPERQAAAVQRHVQRGRQTPGPQAGCQSHDGRPGRRACRRPLQLQAGGRQPRRPRPDFHAIIPAGGVVRFLAVLPTMIRATKADLQATGAKPPTPPFTWPGG